MNEEMVAKERLICDLQDKFIEADKAGVIAVATNYIHLRGELFTELMKDKPITASWNGYRVELSGGLEGRTVMTLTEVI